MTMCRKTRANKEVQLENVLCEFENNQSASPRQSPTKGSSRLAVDRIVKNLFGTALAENKGAIGHLQ